MFSLNLQRDMLDLIGHLVLNGNKGWCQLQNWDFQVVYWRSTGSLCYWLWSFSSWSNQWPPSSKSLETTYSLPSLYFKLAGYFLLWMIWLVESSYRHCMMLMSFGASVSTGCLSVHTVDGLLLWMLCEEGIAIWWAAQWRRRVVMWSVRCLS